MCRFQRAESCLFAIFSALLPAIAFAADEKAERPPKVPAWVEPMRRVHEKFQGTPGTLAQFGDSITVTMAYWAPLAGEQKELPPEMAEAHALVKDYLRPECWREWKGPEFGSNGSMTIRWAHENIDRWLKKLNPEAAVIMFGTNDIGGVPLDEYETKLREVVDRCLARGTVVILSTIPPRRGRIERSAEFAETVRKVAREKHLPLIDYFAEITRRRPDDWDGSLPKFKDSPGDEYQVPTLIARDGVHPSNPRMFRSYSKEALRHNGYSLRNYLSLLAYADVIRHVLKPEPASDEASLLESVAFYASFDEAPRGDVGGGSLDLRTRMNQEAEKGEFVFSDGFDDKRFRSAKGRGVHGGALECLDVLPRNGRIFFPAEGNIAFDKSGWGGAVSLWLNTDPNTALKTPFCDPVQITQKGAGNGGIWIDFPEGKPRDLRMGMFPAVPEAGKPIPESDPNAPLVRVKDIGFKTGDWHHVVLTWRNFDTGRKDAHARLYIDGKLQGEIKDRELRMAWDLPRTGIYVGVNYVGLLDEFAVFDRPVTEREIAQLREHPDLLAPLKTARRVGKRELQSLSDRIAGVASRDSTDREVDRLRRELHQLLTDPDARNAADAVLPLLLRLPARTGTPPEPPGFPFDSIAAQQYQQAYADWSGLPVEFRNALDTSFVLIPPGRFLMGSPADEAGRKSEGYDESRHPVKLSRPFYLSRFETTVRQFRRFVEATGYVTDGERNGGGHAHDAQAVWIHRPGTQWRTPGYAGPFELSDQHPVVHVSHADSTAFCRWLGQRALLNDTPPVTYGLPTEAEWEWACRAGSGGRYWWGDAADESGDVANVGDRTLKRVHPGWPREIMPMDDGHAFPAPVGSFRANAFGLYDMLGNVWEFCSTKTGPYPKLESLDPGDLDPERGFAVRGGGWSNVSADARCAARNADPPHFCHSNLGFRVALRISRP